MTHSEAIARSVRAHELRANRRQRHFERLARARSWVEDARTLNAQEQRDAAAHLARIEANTHLYSGVSS